MDRVVAATGASWVNASVVRKVPPRVLGFRVMVGLTASSIKMPWGLPASMSRQSVMRPVTWLGMLMVPNDEVSGHTRGIQFTASHQIAVSSGSLQDKNQITMLNPVDQ